MSRQISLMRRLLSERWNPNNRLVPFKQPRFATVDDEDYALVLPYRWFMQEGSPYVRAYRYDDEHDPFSWEVITLHRFVMQQYHHSMPAAWKTMDIHHKDYDTLNNQKDNLQWLTKQEHGRLHGKQR